MKHTLTKWIALALLLLPAGHTLAQHKPETPKQPVQEELDDLNEINRELSIHVAALDAEILNVQAQIDDTSSDIESLEGDSARER